MVGFQSVPFRWFGKTPAAPISQAGVELDDSKTARFSTADTSSPHSFATNKTIELPQPVTHSRGRRRNGTTRQRNHDPEELIPKSSIWTRLTDGVSRVRHSTTTATNDTLGKRSRSLDEIRGGLNCDSDEIDEVVVDRLWSQPTSAQASVYGDESSVDSDSDSEKSSSGVYGEIRKSTSKPLAIIRWQIWPSIQHFFSPRFDDPKAEKEYQNEDWLQSKRLALVSSMFFIVNWILGVTLIQSPVVLGDQIYYYGAGPVLSVPLVVMCAYNWPRDRSLFYQCFLCVSAWSWSFYQVLFASLCGYGGGESVWTCGTKDFLATFYYTTALQTVALFGTNLKRLPALLGAIAFFVLAAILIIPSRDNWYRYIINFIVFECFLLYMYRRVFDLRLELKQQFERTRKAQMNERKEADSKYRLTSYVFHEVRVPLNTALLAVQNMSASGTIAKSQELEFKALEGSLSMMSKVLNDVLDFNRMDSGKFESLARPYAFHQAMRSMFMPLQLFTNDRGLEFVTDLDVEIDEVARRAAYEFMGETPEDIDRYLKEQPSGEDHWGMVVGDETRLRQVVTNLASNACKFTPAGGRLTISTRLIHPDVRTTKSDRPTGDPTLSGYAPPQHIPVDRSISEELSVENLAQHSHDVSPPGLTDRIVVRIEVTDTGSGIRPQDMAQSKLFSAFNQTEQGRRQGGKGTGLGLALVRLIVKLSGGRLGVLSKVGKGSTFWVELPLGIGAKAVIPPDEFPMPENPNTFKESGFTELFKVASRASRSGGTVLPSDSMVELADAAAKLRARQTPPHPLRSNSAMHTLMDQGGSVDLSLAKYDRHTPTKAIGDPSTGTDASLTDLTDHTSRQREAGLVEVSPSIPRAPTPTSSPPSSDADPTSLPATTPPPSPELPKTSTTTSGSSHVTKRPRPQYVSLPSSSAPLADAPLTSGSTLVSSPIRTPSVLFEALNVLVVDDDPMTRTLMRRLLERLGCNVTTAENGDVALKLLLSQENVNTPGVESQCEGILERPLHETRPSKFSCIFLDNQMPVMSGLKLVEELRHRGRKDFVVGVTGNALITDQKEYLDAGADHVLTKPVLEGSLKSMLLLAEKRRRQPDDVHT